MSKKTSSFIVYPVEDKHKSYSYDSRYLDSLASMFAVQAPCAAIVFFHNKFFLSYNSDANLITTNQQKEIELLIQTKKKGELITRYLTFNSEFKDLIKNQAEHNSELDKKLVEEIKSFYKKIQNNKQILEKHCYSNSAIKTAFTVDFPEPTISAIEETKSILGKKLEAVEAIIAKKEDFFREIYVQYFTILNQLKQCNDIVLKQLFLRPLQDVEKVLYHLEKTGINVTIEILRNSENLHAEVNISQKFPCLGENYIGVSRLCCAPCNDTLTVYKYDHRGTHGICDSDWKPPAKQFEELVQALELKKTSADLTTQLYGEHRRLSIDEFELQLSEFYQLKTDLSLIGEFD
jgi:hypothetical protein